MVKFPHIAINMKSMDETEVAVKIQEYTHAKETYLPDRIRCVRNMKAYSALDADQWDQKLSSEMLREGRTPKTYNFIQNIVDGVVGNYIMNWFDPKFSDSEADDQDVLDSVDALQKKYYADKKVFNYKHTSLNAIRYGCIYGGWEELVIDREKDPRGAVKFESLRPDLFIPDMGNLTDETSRKARKAFKEFHLSADQIIFYFPHLSGAVRDQINALKKDVEQSGETYGKPVVDRFEKRIHDTGTKYLCVEMYSMENEWVEQVIDSTTLEEYPDFGIPFGTPEDLMAKRMWVQETGRNYDLNNMIVIQKPKAVMYVTTICIDLALKLEYRKDERQFGYLPFYNWSFLSFAGKQIGVVDLVLDAQQDINNREAAKTKMLTEAPLHGKPVIHPDAFGNDQKLMDDAITDWNDSSKPMMLSRDCPPQLIGAMVNILNGAQINPAIFQDETFKMEIMNQIGRLPPAMQGRTERSGESGLMLSRKVVEGSIMQRVPLENLIKKEHDKSTDYAHETIRLCSGSTPSEKLANLNRTFRDPDGNRIVINEVIGYDDANQPVVKRDIGRLKHLEVEISEIKENDMVRNIKVEKATGALQVIPPSAENDVIRATIEGQLVKNLDHSTTADKERAEEVAELRANIAMENARLKLESIQLQRKQVQMQVQAMDQGGGMPGMPQPGMPEGSAPTGEATPSTPVGSETGMMAEREPVSNVA